MGRSWTAGQKASDQPSGENAVVPGDGPKDQVTGQETGQGAMTWTLTHPGTGETRTVTSQQYTEDKMAKAGWPSIERRGVTE